MANSIISKILGSDEQVNLLTSKVESLEASLSEATNLQNSLTENVKALSETIAAKDSELAEKVGKITELERAVADLKAEQTFAAEKATEIIAQEVGVVPVSITVEETKLTAQELNEKLNSISDLHERAAFYAKHKNEFLS